MGIALGLGAALFWGLADYSAAIASRRVGTLQVVLGFHLLATALLAIAVFSTGALSDVSWEHTFAFVGIGALGAASYLTFYRALSIGPISIVSPVVSGYAAVTVVLAVIILGERLSTGTLIAVLIAMLGVLLASTDLAQIRRTERVAALGIGLAVATMVLIGAYLFWIAYYADELGWLAPIFLGRAFSTVFLVGVALRGGEWRFPDRSPGLLATIALIAVLDTGGYVFFNFGIRHADTSVVATASAPYAVVPIVMGVLLLGERPARSQWAGVALVISGLLLLGLAGG
jgi:drug/metabolite transporter (DMT)-like permease